VYGKSVLYLFFHGNKTRLSRYVKLNPHIVLPNYIYSLWIDANIEIVDNTIYERVEVLIEKKSLIAHVEHPFHNCIYRDIEMCILDAKDKLKLLLSQYNFLIKEGYPADFGLYENNLIFRKHNDPIVIFISNEWWKLFMRFAKRDQLNLNYIYWKIKFKPDLILPSGINVRNCPGFKYYPHRKYSFIKRIFLKYKTIRNRLFMFVIKYFRKR